MSEWVNEWSMYFRILQSTLSKEPLRLNTGKITLRVIHFKNMRDPVCDAFEKFKIDFTSVLFIFLLKIS